MDYYKLLNFDREPFSNSPDPGLFYNSRQHLEALQGLEISIRLKRGLNVVTGDIGTGKTTLSRQVIQKISNDDSIKYYVVLDPGFSSTKAFLKYLLDLFLPEKQDDIDDETRLKEVIKKHLFTCGVDNHTNIILIIDEGQKLTLNSMEVLRELLNFETNDQKLLQIVIFAQKEFDHSLNQVKNFKDRINFYYQLNPLNYKETKGLIRYRLEECFMKGKARPLFTPSGYFQIYRATRGFPRRIVNLCHKIILSLIMQNKSKAGFFLVRSCTQKVSHETKYKRPGFLFIVLLFLLSVFSYHRYYDQDLAGTILSIAPPTNKTIKTSLPAPKTAEPQKEIIKQAMAKTPQKEKTKQITSVTPPKKAKAALKKPNIYGSIEIPANSTLIHMIYIVYGSYDASYVDKIMKVNPAIQRPEKIAAGMPINFPVMSGSDGPDDIDDNEIFIVLSEQPDINSAFQTAYHYRSDKFKIRILPVWNEQKGFLFPVVINKSFVSMDAADNYKKDLPGDLFTESKQISLIKNNVKKQKG